MRDTIFISHATPEDNEFTIWLSSRLQLMGYKVWIDKNGLLGGEKIFEEIDQVIRNNAIRVLLIYSRNICQNKKPGILKEGISKEFYLATSIGKENNIKDFIILLKIDDSAFNLFIGANELNQIIFNENWARGLNDLIKKFNKEAIHKFDDIADQDFVSWYENQYIIQNNIELKNELYYSNWWPISRLPEYFYIYQFQNERQAKAVLYINQDYPTSRIASTICSFNPEISIKIKEENNEYLLKPINQYKIKINEMLVGFDGTIFPTQKDAQNNFKHLLRKTFHQLMKNRKMMWYELANKKYAYYYTTANLSSRKVNYEYPHKIIKEKTKNLIGQYQGTYMWHFAISIKTILKPHVAFSLKNHITFTNDGVHVWEDKNKIHTHRRSKGKRFFNEEWRDLMIAFLHGLKDNMGKIEIALNKDFKLELEPWTIKYSADFGYIEPKNKKRQNALCELDGEDNEEIEEKNSIGSYD